MNKFRVLLSIVATFLPLFLEGMVSYVHLLTPDNKRILIVGDWHRPTDPRFVQAFHDRIGYMAAHLVTQPIPLITEYNEALKDDGSILIPQTIKKLLSLQREQEDLTDKQFEIKTYDPRGEISMDLHECLTAISGVILAGQNAVDMEAYYCEGKAVQKGFDLNIREKFSSLVSKVGPVTSFTVGDYLAYLKSLELELEKSAHQCTDPQVKSILMDGLQRFEESRERCVEFLQGPSSQTFVSALVNLFNKLNSTDEILRLYDELYYTLVQDSDLLYYELNLLLKTYGWLKKRPLICLYIGYGHLEKMAEFFTQGLGCHVIDKAEKEFESYPLFTSYYSTIFKTLLPIEVIDSFLDPITLKREVCWCCKKEKQDLKQCGSCRRARYCDRTCQNTHWKVHKAVCLKVSEPVTVRTTD